MPRRPCLIAPAPFRPARRCGVLRRTRPRPGHGCRQWKIRTHHCRRSPGGCPVRLCLLRRLRRHLHRQDRWHPLPMPPPVPTGESGSDAWGPVRIEKLSQIRRTIAEQMVRVGLDDPARHELRRCRRYRVGAAPPGRSGDGLPSGSGQNLKLTTMPFVMKAVAMVLRRHPPLNAIFDEPKIRSSTRNTSTWAWPSIRPAASSCPLCATPTG